MTLIDSGIGGLGSDADLASIAISLQEKVGANQHLACMHVGFGCKVTVVECVLCGCADGGVDAGAV